MPNYFQYEKKSAVSQLSVSQKAAYSGGGKKRQTVEIIGADRGSRTPHLHITNVLLYRMSYVGSEGVIAFFQGMSYR